MNTYITIVNKECEAEKIQEVLRDIGEITRLFDNAFLIKTNETATYIRDELYVKLGSETSIYVCKLSKGSAWRNTLSSNILIKSLYSNEEE